MSRITPQSSVRKIGQKANNHRVFRAFLAEEYDGIGQYVMVTLSRNAVTNALRARVGSGDFGTGQTIPEGTPISILSYHGQIEILSLGAK